MEQGGGRPVGCGSSTSCENTSRRACPGRWAQTAATKAVPGPRFFPRSRTRGPPPVEMASLDSGRGRAAKAARTVVALAVVPLATPRTRPAAATTDAGPSARLAPVTISTPDRLGRVALVAGRRLSCPAMRTVQYARAPAFSGATHRMVVWALATLQLKAAYSKAPWRDGEKRTSSTCGCPSGRRCRPISSTSTMPSVATVSASPPSADSTLHSWVNGAAYLVVALAVRADRLASDRSAAPLGRRCAVMGATGARPLTSRLTECPAPRPSAERQRSASPSTITAHCEASTRQVSLPDPPPYDTVTYGTEASSAAASVGAVVTAGGAPRSGFLALDARSASAVMAAERRSASGSV